MDYRDQAEANTPVAKRDTALGLLRQARRWLAVASLALIGAFGALLAHAKPGKSSVSNVPASSGTPNGPRFTQRPLGAGSSSGIQPPAQAPAPAPPAPAPSVVSGGS